jgi:imidazolonepropionase-like amidohydrolase
VASNAEYSPLKLSALALLLTLPAARGAELLPPGHRPAPPGVHALVGGRIVIKPGEVLESGVVVLRDGFIRAVGRELEPPADARVWNMKGLTIYAGFIDAHLALGASNPPVLNLRVEPVDRADGGLTAGGVRFFGVPGEERDPGGPGPGSELTAIRPQRRVVQNLSPAKEPLEQMRELGFTAANVVPEGGVLRGTSAFIALSDRNPNDAILRPDVFQHVAFEAGGAARRGPDPAPAENPFPRSLMGVIAAVRQAFFDAQHYGQDHADYQARPAGRTRPPFNPAMEALGPAVARRMPVMFEPGGAVMVDRAARVARELGVEFHLVASGQEWRRPDLARVEGAAFLVPLNFPALPKMPEDEDWTQVTLDQLRAWDWAAENPAVLRRNGNDIALTTYGLPERKNFHKNLLAALDRGLAEDDALAALTTVPARLCGLETRLGSIEPGKLANLTVVEGDFFSPEGKVREVWIDGRVYRTRFDKPKAPAAPPAGDAAARPPANKRQADLRDLLKQRVARSPQDGRGPLAAPAAVFVKNAKVWTCGPQGTLEDADLLVADGRIKAVGKKLTLPGEFAGRATEIDAQDAHVTPGLIDAHSHSFALGSVNEGSIPSSAMVRIGDVINPETDNFFRQLAGGLTAASLLHGSANPIGGQNVVLKLKDGATPEELKMAGAPSGIKFALGENVKQSNWGDRNTTRFPQTRMGVGTFLANRFEAARQYLQARDRHRREGGVPPRRDLELEALGEVIEGKRWIHCHSYRQDEILAFLRLMEEYGVRVGTLQHVLEGYKVADEIARHGAGASCFSDWWAYKFEVYDAIPHAGSLMRERGALVSFNSDSSDLARRMNLEAAKAVKYGGAPPEEALRFVTLNPAKQLRIDERVGSLDPGKDGDFAIWSGHPLDTRSVCLQTWIEGKKYFERERASERFEARAKERVTLLDKARKALKLMEAAGAPEPGRAETAAFFHTALELQHEHESLHCEDE